MTSKNPIRFTLGDNTKVIVQKVANNKYDFELILPTGNHKTFIWNSESQFTCNDKKGNPDVLVSEAIKQFMLSRQNYVPVGK